MDFSLYVTISPKVCKIASTAPGGQMFCTDKVLDVITAGATAIQLREDSYMETSDFIKIAKAVHELALLHSVPLVIHDRVDIAVSAGAEGVELGKGCLDYNTARQLLGDKKFVGVAVSNQRQAGLAIRAQAHYIVMGPVYAPLPGEFQIPAASPLGTSGVREILDSACTTCDNSASLLISGGITSENIQRVMFKTKGAEKSVNGVVLHYSAIEDHGKMISEITEIKSLMKSRPKFLPRASPVTPTFTLSKLGQSNGVPPFELADIFPKVPAIVRRVGEKMPAVGCFVPSWAESGIQSMCAAIGSAPTFSYDFEEPEVAANVYVPPESCLITMNSTAPVFYNAYLAALKAYNLKACPVVFEPTGAIYNNPHRTKAALDLIASGYISLIKGKYMEILHLSSLATEGGYSDILNLGAKEFQQNVAKRCKDLATREKCVVLATGPTNVISDGNRTVVVENGPMFLEQAGGYTLGAVLAAYMAVELADPFLAVLSGMLVFTIKSGQAAYTSAIKGPGTFLPSFIDEMWEASQVKDEPGSADWLRKGVVWKMRV